MRQRNLRRFTFPFFTSCQSFDRLVAINLLGIDLVRSHVKIWARLCGTIFRFGLIFVRLFLSFLLAASIRRFLGSWRNPLSWFSTWSNYIRGRSLRQLLSVSCSLLRSLSSLLGKGSFTWTEVGYRCKIKSSSSYVVRVGSTFFERATRYTFEDSSCLIAVFHLLLLRLVLLLLLISLLKK